MPPTPPRGGGMEGLRSKNRSKKTIEKTRWNKNENLTSRGLSWERIVDDLALIGDPGDVKTELSRRREHHFRKTASGHPFHPPGHLRRPLWTTFAEKIRKMTPKCFPKSIKNLSKSLSARPWVVQGVPGTARTTKILQNDALDPPK